ncbi:hypothetical protein V6N12_069818 [Hibiscus sabdariffa]|uniref:Uncharacterized protein n=1 Tax=Hibiscus sabdariffa TaxID=183260 RepID=A0ABR2FEY1_9ROSI
MSGFDRAVEWLRPFVHGNWFIEWEDCCCSACFNVKEEKDELKPLGPFCRDSHLKHPIRSKACEALSHFPFVISLYAGDQNMIHGEIREDHNMIELVTSQCNAVLKPEVATAESYTKANLDNWYNFPFSISLSTSAPRIELIPPVSDSSSHLSLDGSYCGSSPSIEHPPFASDYTYISQDEQFKQLISAHYGAKRSRCSKNVSEQQARFSLDRNTSVNNRMRTTSSPKKRSTILRIWSWRGTDGRR